MIDEKEDAQLKCIAVDTEADLPVLGLSLCTLGRGNPSESAMRPGMVAVVALRVDDGTGVRDALESVDGGAFFAESRMETLRECMLSPTGCAAPIRGQHATIT